MQINAVTQQARVDGRGEGEEGRTREGREGKGEWVHNGALLAPLPLLPPPSQMLLHAWTIKTAVW